MKQKFLERLYVVRLNYHWIPHTELKWRGCPCSTSSFHFTVEKQLLEGLKSSVINIVPLCFNFYFVRSSQLCLPLCACAHPPVAVSWKHNRTDALASPCGQLLVWCELSKVTMVLLKIKKCSLLLTVSVVEGMDQDLEGLLWEKSLCALCGQEFALYYNAKKSSCMYMRPVCWRSERKP